MDQPHPECTPEAGADVYLLVQYQSRLDIAIARRKGFCCPLIPPHGSLPADAYPTMQVAGMPSACAYAGLKTKSAIVIQPRNHTKEK